MPSIFLWTKYSTTEETNRWRHFAVSFIQIKILKLRNNKRLRKNIHLLFQSSDNKKLHLNLNKKKISSLKIFLYKRETT